MKLTLHNACTLLLFSGLLRPSSSFQSWATGLMSEKVDFPSDKTWDGRKRRLHETSLKMGAFNKGNKQADLLAKMKQAQDKKRSAGGDDNREIVESGASSSLTAKELKEKNDRKRFEDLLNSDAATVAIMDEFGKDSYQSKSQEEEELSLSSSRRINRKDRLFEGDPAPSKAFEHLVSSSSGNPIGAKGTTKLLPWLGSSTSQKYIAVLSDPRSKSTDLRESVQAVESSIPAGVLKNLIVINADSPLENKKFAKKFNIKNIAIYSDNENEWMKEYTALGEKRWSTTLYILANGTIQKLVREVDPLFVSKIVTNAVKSINQ